MLCIKGIGIASVMMPVVTWSMKYLNYKYTTDGTAIMNCLRNIAGALGSAVFVAVMSFLSASSENAGITPNVAGIRFTFLWMTILSLVQLAISTFLISNYNSANLHE
ncbi:hypothetical protein CLPUN_44590 [Clostridium puniceum]|uniref:Uncharacterized protein n=2 Tax=Clostridium puniceum TaxID=29367 RepID=A0A1S8T8B4_9CLOT|nr:hypothetical protein CLPUN_44590 [Clostridium puniceum]